MIKKRKHNATNEVKQYLGINMEQGGILLKRCVTKADFLQSGKQQKGLSTVPIWIQSDNVCYALVEEVILVKC